MNVILIRSLVIISNMKTFLAISIALLFASSSRAETNSYAQTYFGNLEIYQSRLDEGLKILKAEIPLTTKRELLKYLIQEVRKSKNFQSSLFRTSIEGRLKHLESLIKDGKEAELLNELEDLKGDLI